MTTLVNDTVARHGACLERPHHVAPANRCIVALTVKTHVR